MYYSHHLFDYQGGGLGGPGSVVLLNGHLGAGKSTISRGFVRAACRDPILDVPSPTFLLCLTYKEDLGHEPELRQQQLVESGTVIETDPRENEAAGDGKITEASEVKSSLEQEAEGDGAKACGALEGAPAAPAVHHMDPYRLGSKVDKMSGLIDWETAFKQDVCLIEWPDKMPKGESWDS